MTIPIGSCPDDWFPEDFFYFATESGEVIDFRKLRSHPYWKVYGSKTKEEGRLDLDTLIDENRLDEENLQLEIVTHKIRLRGQEAIAFAKAYQDFLITPFLDYIVQNPEFVSKVLRSSTDGEVVGGYEVEHIMKFWWNIEPPSSFLNNLEGSFFDLQIRLSNDCFLNAFNGQKYCILKDDLALKVMGFLIDSLKDYRNTDPIPLS